MENNYGFEIFIGCIVTLIIFGILGNSLTLTSVIYATIKKRHNFNANNWPTSTVFIFNLAFVDLGACLLTLAYLIYAAITYASREHLDFDLGDTQGICKFFIIGIQDFALITGWSIALISFFRAFTRYR